MTKRFNAKRGGFTIIELLVVLVIISILAALSVGVIGGMMESARRAATSATLSKIDGRIKSRLQTLGEIDLTQYEILAEGLGARSDRSVEKTVLARKILYKEALPQSWNEFAERFPETWDDIYSEAQASLGNTVAGGPHPPGLPSTPESIAAESAEVLYYTLTRAPIPGQGRRKAITGFGQTDADEFSDDELKDTDGDGLLELVDAWETPLRFYRWPTRLIRDSSNPTTDPVLPAELANAKALIPSLTTVDAAAKDADDPYDVIVDMINDGVFSLNQFEREFHTPSTYQIPLVVSAGEDEKLGLSESVDNDTSNLGHLCRILNFDEVTDNLSNRNNNAGGN